VLLGPGQHRGVKINANRRIVRTPTDPLAAHVGRATEILAQGSRFAAPKVPKCFVDEINFRFGILNGFFLENVAIGKIGQC